MSKKTIQRIEKPWGYELIWAKTERYVGKILFINKGHKLSLQYHREKDETIFVKSGTISFIYENDTGTMEEITMSPGDAHHILPGRKHRMVAIIDSELFEVSTPQLDDVVRIEDGYGRTGTSKP